MCSLDYVTVVLSPVLVRVLPYQFGLQILISRPSGGDVHPSTLGGVTCQSRGIGSVTYVSRGLGAATAWFSTSYLKHIVTIKYRLSRPRSTSVSLRRGICGVSEKTRLREVCEPFSNGAYKSPIVFVAPAKNVTVDRRR